ncbi:MAG: hypothetical protein E7626_05190 [Ruminococcaceae bacterium]|nr:hypothetical protein [Oscillospiraceae bacterium]
MLNRRNVISGVVILLLLALMVFSIAKLLESRKAVEDGNGDDSRTLEIDGVKYSPRQDVNVFMLVGIDREGKHEDSNSYRNSGEADMISLLIFDESDKTYSILCLNRDTMLEMPTIGLGGKYAGKAYGQLALSHTYGSGLIDSCQNVKKTVSSFLYNLEIEYCLSLTMDAVAKLNDAVGGVTVNVTDDFPAETGILKGEGVKLSGEQALNFVRTRKDVGDQLNVSRMKRHEEYMKGFMSALNTKLNSDEDFIVSTYRDLSDYVVTDCTLDSLQKFVSRYSDYQFKEIVSPVGENTVGEKYMEFKVDPKELEKLVIRLFYNKQES